MLLRLYSINKLTILNTMYYKIYIIGKVIDDYEINELSSAWIEIQKELELI
jgi:hypothetical protein